MGVTTRAAAQRKAEAEATKLLDLPDTVLERILVAASDGGEFYELCAARLVSARVRAAADAAARGLILRVGPLTERALAPLALLPRLGALAKAHVLVDLDPEQSAEKAGEIAAAVCGHCPRITNLWLDGAHVLTVTNMARSFGVLGGAPQLALLTSLALDWRGKLHDPLAPLARLTRLTALELWGYAQGVNEVNWLPPNLEVLHLAGHAAPKWVAPHGIGGAGWLAALHAGACPRLRALRLTKLAVRDVRPHGRWEGFTLANTLPRLTALEELVVAAYSSTDAGDYGDPFGEFDDDDDNPSNFGSEASDFSSDDDDDGGGGGPWQHAVPIPAAPLLAALPSLRHCRMVFVRLPCDRDMNGAFWSLIASRVTPMLYATPVELAALQAPRLESLVSGLTDPSSGNGLVCCCSGVEVGIAGAHAGAAFAPAAGISAGGSGLPALRSLELYAGCCCKEGQESSLWDLSALPPNSLPALRRLAVLPRCFECDTANLPLDAVARAAPGLERLVIDPRCAGPLDALFCADDGDGCALSLRWLAVLPPREDDTVTPARIDAELRSGLRARAVAARRAAGSPARRIKVTLFTDEDTLFPGAAAQPAAARTNARGAAVARRAFDYKDGEYVANFLLTGLRRGPLCVDQMEFKLQVDAYEREHA